MSCYEAGRDGFWIHRALTQRGVEQSGRRFGEHRSESAGAAHEDRSARRAKLVMMLVRVWCGRAAGVERSPRADGGGGGGAARESRADGADAGADAAAQSDARVAGDVGRRVAARSRRRDGWWTRRARLGGRAVAGGSASAARARGGALGPSRRRRSHDSTRSSRRRWQRGRRRVRCAHLVQLKGVATTSASVLLDEGLVWRAFQNRRQIGGLLGFAPTPYDSGESTREQGISRAGNKRLQAVSIQLAWSWVRWQPAERADALVSANALGTGKRARRIGIVALARKLLIALWRYVTNGVVPDGRDLESRVAAPVTRLTRAARTVRAGSLQRPHGEGTAAHVSGLRLHSLWGPRAMRAARIEGEGESSTHASRRTRVTRRRVLTRADAVRLPTPPARTADGWAVCSAAGTLERTEDSSDTCTGA